MDYSIRETIALRNRALMYYDPRKPSEVEFEVRFGTFRDKFVPGVSRKNFEKVLSKLGRPSMVETYIVCLYGQYRRIISLDENFKATKNVYQSKISVGHVDMRTINTRLSLSLERPGERLVDMSYGTFRYIRRQTYKRGRLRYDLSISNMFGSGELRNWLKKMRERKSVNPMDDYDDNSTFEVEVEIDFLYGSADEFMNNLRSVVAEILNYINVEYNVSSQIMDFVQYISSIFKRLNNQQYSLFALKGLSSISTQVVTLQAPDINNIDTKPYCVTPKADGIRTLVLISGGTVKIGNQMGMQNILRPGGIIPDSLCDTLIDAEFVEGENIRGGPKDRKVPLLTAFDILICKNSDVTSRPFSERLEVLRKFLREYDLNKHITARLFVKEMVIKPEIQSSIKGAFETKTDYETDGIIFVPLEAPYSNSETYKWKPPHMNSIDFLLRKASAKDNMTTYYLFVSINKNDISNYSLSFPPFYKTLFGNRTFQDTQPFPFMTTTHREAYIAHIKYKDLDEKICEMSFDTRKNEWVFMRVREDKTAQYTRGEAQYGNNWNVAQNIWISIFVFPIRREDLINREWYRSMYFQKPSVPGDLFAPLKGLHRNIKDNIYARFAFGVQWMIDIGSGRGQDMYRYHRNNIKSVLQIEPDEAAVAEFLIRKQKRRAYISTDIYTIVKGFLEIPDDDFLSYTGGKVEAIMCNFAVHYFMRNRESVRTFVKKVDNLLKEGGGRFIFTCFDGEKIFNLLSEKKKGESVDFKKRQELGPTELMFSIRKDFTDKKFENFGQQISVKMRNISDYYKEEYLVNIPYILETFSNINPKIRYSYTMSSFSDYVSGYSSRQALSESELEWSALYSVVVITKNK